MYLKTERNGTMVTVQEARKLTCNLISIPSINPGGDIHGAAIFVKEWLEDIGVESKIIKVSGVPNVMATIGKKGGKRLLFNGKFDVVPPGDFSKWDTEPFFPTCKDGYIYGRGSSDMKSGLAAMMLAIKEMKKLEEKLQGEIIFMAVGDGETGGVKGTQTLLETLGSNYDGAIVPEPTDFCVESAQRGLRWVEIRIKGRASHAARPHLGRNAIEQASKIIAALKSMTFDVENNIFEEALRRPSISVNKIHGGIQNNIIAEDCKMLVDRRMLPGETEEKVMKEIEQTVNSVLDEGFRAEFEVVSKGWDPYMLNQDEPILNTVVKAYEKITGEKPVIRGKGGCTDASHIFKAGIPVVILGPGSPDESHTTNEKVSIERIALTADILVDAALNFLSYR
ncbi:MAG: M20 family metallopeptidase [Lachnospiraceae bacterium]|nr:M20 family metallopeptidase [Lachnospiraceae bacterium]